MRRNQFSFCSWKDEFMCFCRMWLFQSAVGSQGVRVSFQCAVEMEGLCSAFLRTLVTTHSILPFHFKFPFAAILCAKTVIVVFFLHKAVFDLSLPASMGRTKRAGFVVSGSPAPTPAGLSFWFQLKGIVHSTRVNVLDEIWRLLAVAVTTYDDGQEFFTLPGVTDVAGPIYVIVLRESILRKCCKRFVNIGALLFWTVTDLSHRCK
jgi:hypothetical protein